MLTVYKASAGSGKTFQLVAEYLKLLLKNPFNYKHILAVTFTNKATNEMKSRILGQLNVLAGNQPTDYTTILENETSLSEEVIRQRARQVLKNILHDYNRFSVSTIDSFTQRIIKAFNREMGISPQVTLELDDDLLLEEATDRLLEKIDSDRQLRKWLVSFSEEKITDNKSQQIEDDIKNLGKELFKEKFQLFFPEKENSVYTRENLKEFRSELNKIIISYESELKQKGAECVRQMENAGLEPDDFSGKSRSIGNFFLKLAAGELPNFTKTIEDHAEEIEKWYTAKSPKKELVRHVVETTLQPLLQEIIAFKNNNEIRYFSAIEANKQLRMLGILTDLKEVIRELLHEKGVLQLSDSNLLLSKIIGESDSPFIYEKIGNQFSHFMLDEFQDTSALQWNNFKPLVANSLSEGNTNLLVGDVKQSIYRWRNSDWNILDEQINTDFPHFQPEEKPLKKNWRSRQNIINFNNAAIGQLKQTFENYLLTDINNEKFKNKFSSIYEHFVQQPGKTETNPTGLAQINFLEKDDFEKQSAELLIEQVKQLQDNGLRAADTAILIRTNKEGTKIIETFVEAAQKQENTGYNLSVISNESLFLFASKGVNFIIFIIELLVDPDNKIVKAALLNLWLSWLKPELESNGQQTIPGIREEKWQLDTDFEQVFEKELQPAIERVKSKVLLASLDESVMEIASLFGLFQMKSELPFLQAFIDQTADIKISISNDLSNLLHWWNETGYKSPVSVNEDVDAIRLLTVHKAKGLEFEAVLLPNFNWYSSWKGNQAPILWCTPETGPFNRFPLLPVKATQTLEKTIFSNDYYEEKLNAYIDTLNLVYVAFTRAKSVLMVNAEHPDEKNNSKGPGKSINHLLKFALEQLEDTSFADCWKAENTQFSYGDLPVFAAKQASSDSEWIAKYHFNNFGERIKLRLNSEDFLIPGELHQSVKNTGKLVHEILSGIETFDDIDAACQKAQNEGKINDEEAAEIKKKLTESIQNSQTIHWFNGSYKVLNEREIISSGQLYRPDRIMISGENAVVVDYKWGEKIPGKYNKQVSRYVQLLRDSGFKQVEGFLWYINQDEVEKVCEI